MSIKPVVTNLKKLQIVCDAVDIEDEFLVSTVYNDLLDTAKNHSNCIGLAAPQIGYPDRIFVMRYDGQFVVVINPKILSRCNSHLEYSIEGCLSRPGAKVRVGRRTKIKVQYVDNLGETVKRKFTNINARVFQHEFDHLNGIVI